MIQPSKDQFSCNTYFLFIIFGLIEREFPSKSATESQSFLKRLFQARIIHFLKQFQIHFSIIHTENKFANSILFLDYLQNVISNQIRIILHSKVSCCILLFFYHDDSLILFFVENSSVNRTIVHAYSCYYQQIRDFK
eukprot:TRINITY_DN6576_c0_g1_i2.p1 TRINITY_DN6576_c0_g1~~TRINITY_DN6576_c0_g1_i2.p1  ORF type:complete len:137 (+),score=12.52 TRINITY_DN6576_c0_g1_i2:125-535(+)